MWSNNYAKELSSTLNKRCSLKQININGNISRPVHYNSEVRMLKSNANIEMPMVEKKPKKQFQLHPILFWSVNDYLRRKK